jgi:hypothetical protein
MAFPGMLTRGTLENAFIVGLLLTGSIEQTEVAILESVRCSHLDELCSKELFRNVIHFAVDSECLDSERGWNERQRASALLPFELNCVLALEPDLRHCYVLRILVALPREVCAWLLGLDTSEVDRRTRAAMLELVEVHGIAQQSVESEMHRGSKATLPRDASHTWFPIHPTRAGSAFTSHLPLVASATKDPAASGTWPSS